MRTCLVACAIAACRVQPSKMGRSGPPSPIDARWSKSHTWSKPASSAIRQTVRRASMVVSCPDSFSPNRTGWVIEATLTRAVPTWTDAQHHVVLAREALGCPAVTLDQGGVLANVDRHLVGERVASEPPGTAVDADHVPAVWRRVEVQRHAGVSFDVLHLLTRHGIDEERLPIPPEPDRNRVGPATGAHGG